MNEESHKPSGIALAGRSEPRRRHIPVDAVIQTLSVEAGEAARLCGVGRSTWYSLRKAGRVPKPVRLGRRVLWRVEELREWMAAGCPPLSRWDTLKKGHWQ